MINNLKVLAITLARGGSKRIHKKNISQIKNRPLIYYTFKEVKKSKYIDTYIVSSDCPDIVDVCKKYNVSYHIRSSELSKDTTTSAAAIIDVVERYRDYDIVVEIMATNPLKTVDDIDGVLEKLIQTSADSVVSVVRIWDHHPSRVKYIVDDRMLDFYPEVSESRRQDLTPAAYVRNGSIYAMTTFSLLKTTRRLGENTRPYIMPQCRSINIDEPIDLELAKILIKEDA